MGVQNADVMIHNWLVKYDLLNRKNANKPKAISDTKKYAIAIDSYSLKGKIQDDGQNGSDPTSHFHIRYHEVAPTMDT